MNWTYMRQAAWLDTRARFVQQTPRGGALLDLASAEGETLRHFHELRPDLRFYSVDILGLPEAYPPGCQFFRGDLEKDRIPWPDHSVDTVTCMHLVEHMTRLEPMFAEVARLLKPGGRLYVETPHPRTAVYPSARHGAAGVYIRNFYDAPCHLRLMPVGLVAYYCREAGLRVDRTGISRNWLITLAHLVYMWGPASRKKNTAWCHFHGWSAYLTAHKES